MQMQAKLKHRFAEQPETLQAIQEYFDEETLKPFAGLETQHKQKFYRENFDLQVHVHSQVSLTQNLSHNHSHEVKSRWGMPENKVISQWCEHSSWL